MTRPVAIAVTFLAAAIGLAAGLWIADWRFNDPDVLLASRVLLGGGGAIVMGFAAKWLLLRQEA